MVIFFIIYVVVVLFGMKLCPKKNGYFTDYLDKDNTTQIKGICILLVVFSHFNAHVTYVSVYDLIYVKILALIGQIMVVPFMFYSGFGVMEQIKKRGQQYIDSFPKKRMFYVFLNMRLQRFFLYWCRLPSESSGL